MALARGRRIEPVNYWPGFVDALSTMLLIIIFLLSVFMLSQFFLSREVTGKDSALERLNRQIEELTTLLAMERSQSGVERRQDHQTERDARSGAQGQDRSRDRGDERRRRRGGGRQSRRRGRLGARRAESRSPSARWRRSTC